MERRARAAEEKAAKKAERQALRKEGEPRPAGPAISFAFGGAGRRAFGRNLTPDLHGRRVEDQT
ncbi:hypothetical protein [Neomegalonema perideroedes]|uniref:hypothetical protein n=1 Tax=Neomegalonema perideroedes TaxID=217219 RepID=UPI0003694891|nr:hypothetical protein [Neomegalonema perideroedes]